MEEPKEVWPPAPQGMVNPSVLADVPRSSVGHQIAWGLIAGIIFVPCLWWCLTWLWDYLSKNLFIDWVSPAVWIFSLVVALVLSRLTWRRYRAFSITFAVVSIVVVAFVMIGFMIFTPSGPSFA